jgi:hypothetical protein
VTDQQPEHDADEPAEIPRERDMARHVTPPDSDPADDPVDEMELESFPASDSHSGWAGPPDP